MPHNIHPSSIIDPRAELGEGVEIGPWCRVEGAVTIGANTRLIERATLKGPLKLGQRNVLYGGATLGLEPQDRKFDASRDGAGLVVGDDNIFRECVTVHRATQDQPTTIGHRNYFMVSSHAGHDTVIGDGCTLVNSALVAGHATLGDNVIVSGNASVHQFCRVGRLAMVGGNCGVVKDVPPFCIVYAMKSVGSLNLVGLRRAGLRQHISPLQQAFDILYRSQLPNDRAANLIESTIGEDALCREFVAFIRASQRGISAYGGNSSDEP